MTASSSTPTGRPIARQPATPFRRRFSAASQLKGNAAIGHDRYATTGGAGLRNVQPLFADFEFGGFAISHNGNLTTPAGCATSYRRAARSSRPRTPRCSCT